MRIVRCIVFSLLLGALIVSSATSASAVDRGVIDISPTSASVTKTYPAIPGVRPNACQVNCTMPYAQTQSPGCKAHNGAYCDAIQLNINKPDGYGDDLYQVVVTLTWVKGVTDNKMNLFVFAEEDPVLGPSLVDNRTEDNPKRVKIFAPDKGTLFMTIVNERGVNSGYKLNVLWEQTPIPEFIAPPRKSFGSTTGQSVAAARLAAVSPAFEAPQADGLARTPSRGRTALVPGPDGELVEMSLPIVARGNRTAGAASGIDLVTGLVVGTLLFAGAAFAVVMVRRRRVAESL